MDWKPYAISIGVGLLVGVLNGLLNTRSPTPPIIALPGLLGRSSFSVKQGRPTS